MCALTCTDILSCSGIIPAQDAITVIVVIAVCSYLHVIHVRGGK